MRTNDGGLSIIKHFEGFSPVPYLCPAGIATIVTPSIYTREENFDEAALVIDDLASLDFAAVEALFR